MGRRVSAGGATAIASIFGSSGIGSVLTAVPDANLQGTLSYQWKRDGVNISGATSQTYTLVSADEGYAITCAVSGLIYTAGPMVAVIAANLTTDPTIDGITLVGEVLTYTSGTVVGTSPVTTLQWFRDGAPIAGAYGTNYTVIPADSDKTITVRQTVANSAASVSRTSAGVVIGVYDPIPAGSIFLNSTAILFNNNSLVFA